MRSLLSTGARYTTMTSEQAKTLSENALNQLMDALDRGQSDALKLYLSVMSRFHRYSFSNSLLIYTHELVT
jgi:hypothetical protein